MKTGAELLHDSLANVGVRMIFGIPGSDTLPFYDELLKSQKIKHILVRHEQAAVHAADGFYRVSGKIAATISTSGPGSTNLVTGLASAFADSIPLISITINTRTEHLGKGSFQEVDIVSITKTVVKKNFQVTSAADIPTVINEASMVAITRPQGPVLIDIPNDVLKEKTKFSTSPYQTKEKETKIHIDKDLLAKVLKIIADSNRPVFLVGEGLIAEKSIGEFRKIIEKTKIPVATTVSGVGILSEDHPLSLQVGGILGTSYASLAIQNADALIVMGTSLETRTTGDKALFAKNAKIIHIDMDSSKCGLFINPDICVHMPITEFIKGLNRYIVKSGFIEKKEWLGTISKWKKDMPLNYKSSGNHIKPQKVVEVLNSLAPDSTLFVGNGLHKYWTMRYFTFKIPRQFNVSSRFGCMGFAFPGSIGAKLAEPKRQVIAIVGDGDFQMNIQELATAVENNLDIKVIIVNNRALGAIYQHQHFSYQDRFIGSYYNIDINFAKIAKAYGAKGERISKPSQIEHALKIMLNTKGVYVLEVMIRRDEYLLPKISTSDSLDKIYEMMENNDSL